MDFHKVNGPIDFSQLFLSCSTDWSVKLWLNGKGVCAAHANHSSSLQPRHTRPLHSFEESGEYIYDVKVRRHGQRL